MIALGNCNCTTNHGSIYVLYEHIFAGFVKFNWSSYLPNGNTGNCLGTMYRHYELEIKEIIKSTDNVNSMEVNTKYVYEINQYTGEFTTNTRERTLTGDNIRFVTPFLDPTINTKTTGDGLRKTTTVNCTDCAIQLFPSGNITSGTYSLEIKQILSVQNLESEYQARCSALKNYDLLYIENIYPPVPWNNQVDGSNNPILVPRYITVQYNINGEIVIEEHKKHSNPDDNNSPLIPDNYNFLNGFLGSGFDYFVGNYDPYNFDNVEGYLIAHNYAPPYSGPPFGYQLDGNLLVGSFSGFFAPVVYMENESIVDIGSKIRIGTQSPISPMVIYGINCRMLDVDLNMQSFFISNDLLTPFNSIRFISQAIDYTNWINRNLSMTEHNMNNCKTKIDSDNLPVTITMERLESIQLEVPFGSSISNDIGISL